MAKWNGQTTIDYTLHRKLKFKKNMFLSILQQNSSYSSSSYQLLRRIYRYQRGNKNKSNKDRHLKGKKKKSRKGKIWRTKLYTENQRACNANLTKTRGWTQMLRHESSSRSTSCIRRV